MSDNDFMANLQKEGDDVNLDEVAQTEPDDQDTPSESEREETDTPSDSPPDTKDDDKQTGSPPEEEEAKDEEASPEDGAKEEPVVLPALHEHPGWIAREARFRAQDEKREGEIKELKETIAQFQERTTQQFEKQQESKAIPRWAVDIGWDQNIWNEYQTANLNERKQIKDEVMAELKPFLETAEKSKKQSELDDWASKEWKALETDEAVQTDLKKLGVSLDAATQQEISGVISKYLPTDDATGNISVRKGYEIWKDLKAVAPKTPKPKASTEEKKKVADKTIKKSAASESVRDYKTSADFVGKSFTDL